MRWSELSGVGGSKGGAKKCQREDEDGGGEDEEKVNLEFYSHASNTVDTRVDTALLSK